MIGAIIGDIVGSRFEWDNHRSKDFDFLTYKCFFTDDSVMSLAICDALMICKHDFSDLSDQAVKSMQVIGRPYPSSGYGGMFYKWIYSDSPEPYYSFGNGAAMRVSACGYVATSIEEAKLLSHKVTVVTHNDPEGIKGAEAIAVAVYLARRGENILEIRDYIDKHYYPMNFTLDGIRETYQFNETCQETVPQALVAFFESLDFEDAIRNAVSIGGDSDTLAAITGGVAEAYYGVPTHIRKYALTFLDERLLKILLEFENFYPAKMEKIQSSGSVSIKEESAGAKIKTGGREEMIQSAMDAADEALKNSTSEPEETTSQKLFSHLFEACNILRGPINRDEYKSYVTPILFFKRLSDVYDEETQAALEESGGDEEFSSFPENHRFIIPDGCHWQDVREVSENVGVAIINAMNGIERANPDTLYGVFSSFDDANWTDKNKLSDERLKDLIEHMSEIKVGNENYSSDVMGDSYEYLIKKFADLSKKNAGEFYTPRSVVELMVKILDPKPGETVYDPACGTGGMLIEAIRNVHDDKSTYGRIYGQEKNLATSSIARMNLFLHGARDFKVKQGDTLKSPLFLHRGELQTFDCVIANPPFSLKAWGADQFASDIYGRNLWGTPSDSSADFAWLQHMVKSMDKKNGRCAVVLPQGVLFHGGREREIREQLIESDKLECVITLVSGLFYSTGVSACILILNNNKVQEHEGKVCLIDASKIYTAQRAQNIMTEEDVEEVYNLFKNYESVIEKSKIVSIEDIKLKECTLSVNSYIEKASIETICPQKVKKAFLSALDEAIEAEENLKSLLIEGGYISEQ
ncbi:N-6 DNA methylase [Paenibacillus polymyxa]|jgi:type I restriction enzyme M protein|uniref:N-6 DNA methylase n=1 Tax=Paenibacillus TaxID=44249 RepID=UPI000D2F81E6|nr:MULTISPECIES: N-6 DNA methylase [Paenibacillus]KAF6616168.1 N-6 DNA methylase [Paenibacillus sp. EKM101P]KAF6618002.1 N-6 DNA methylase [Paenibacillus sp. EKM102P]KAF6626072.1 N-6 DNA methylase [Paenibacillus sp. EKM10P]KAF6642575.1 N-6 DNA methylase [Paenibacillus sp. EKM11P]MBY0020908.1 N-6 DNA methylase [Paenibacillus polymyxa]